MKIRVLKTMLAAVIALTLAVLSIPASFAAETSGTAGDSSYWSFDSSTGTLTVSGTGSVYGGWNDLVPLIKKVVVEEGITYIATVFQNHSNMESLELPASLNKVDYYALDGCSALSHLVLPDGVRLEADLYDTALYSNPEFCENNAIYINDRLVETDYKKVAGEFTVREGTRIIDYGAFADCQSLEKVTLPDSVTTIGEYAFADCYSLTQINIPSGVKCIAKSAFSSCDKLSEINIPDGVTNIEPSAFYSEFSPSRIVNMPKSVKEIKEYAFACNIAEVNYAGSEEEWNSIVIEEDGNENLLNAKINFNSYEEEVASEEEEKENENDSSATPIIVGVGAAVAVGVAAAVAFLIIKKKKS